jgi:hypothetical protein
MLCPPLLLRTKLETDQTKVSKTTTNANSVVIASGGLLLLRRSDLPSWQVANLPTALISFGPVTADSRCHKPA